MDRTKGIWMMGSRQVRGVVCFLLFVPGFVAVHGRGAWADELKSNTAVRPAPREEESWQKRHQRFLDRARKGDVDVLFLGDSITQGWEGKGKKVWEERFQPLKPANFGIGGDRTEHVLWRITEGKELEGIQPRAFVLMIGTNNMGSNTAAEIAEGVTAIVRELRKQRPQAKVLLLGVFPRSPRAADPVRDKIHFLNEKIAKLDDGQHVRYLDIGGKFLTPQGELTKEIMPDYLHLSEKGYELWADAIQALLKEMLGSKN